MRRRKPICEANFWPWKGWSETFIKTQFHCVFRKSICTAFCRPWNGMCHAVTEWLILLPWEKVLSAAKQMRGYFWLILHCFPLICHLRDPFCQWKNFKSLIYFFPKIPWHKSWDLIKILLDFFTVRKFRFAKTSYARRIYLCGSLIAACGTESHGFRIR